VIALRFLDIFKPISRVIPEVKPPERKVSFQNRLIWTVLALLIYFVMSEVPLYGIPITSSGDTYTAYRVIFASTRGTLMELGIGPIVTAGLIIQLLQDPTSSLSIEATPKIGDYLQPPANSSR